MSKRKRSSELPSFCRIEYAGPGPDGSPCKDQGWRVYGATFQQRNCYGEPVKRKDRSPRWSLIKVFDSREAAQQFIMKHWGVTE